MHSTEDVTTIRARCETTRIHHGFWRYAAWTDLDGVRYAIQGEKRGRREDIRREVKQGLIDMIAPGVPRPRRIIWRGK